MEWKDLPFEDFLPMPSLSTTSSAHCICRCSAGSARRTNVPCVCVIGIEVDRSSVVVLLVAVVVFCIAKRGVAMVEEYDYVRRCNGELDTMHGTIWRPSYLWHSLALCVLKRNVGVKCLGVGVCSVCSYVVPPSADASPPRSFSAISRFVLGHFFTGHSYGICESFIQPQE